MNTRHKELELSNFMQNKECHNLIKLLWVLMKLIHPTIGERKNIISPPLTLFVQYMHNIQTIQIYLITNLHLQLYRIFYLWSYIWLFKRIPIFWFNHFMLVGVVQFQLNSFIQHSTCQNVTITCDVFFKADSISTFLECTSTLEKNYSRQKLVQLAKATSTNQFKLTLLAFKKTTYMTLLHVM